MKIFFRTQESKLASYLPVMKSAVLRCGDTGSFPCSRIAAWIPIPEPIRTLQDCNLDFLFSYDVFPPRLLKFFGEWQLENRAMRIDDVIVQQATVPPVAAGLKLVFGVRVISVWRSETEAGFSYGTLRGHPETGTNQFSVCIKRNCVFAVVRTVAIPGTSLSRLLGPIFTQPYVNFCNRQALLRMKEQFLAHNRIQAGCSDGK